MTLPAVEVKLVWVVHHPARTRALIRIYRVTDGGLDSAGHPIYTRTLFRAIKLSLDAGWTVPRLQGTMHDRVVAEAITQGLPTAEDRLICAL